MVHFRNEVTYDAVQSIQVSEKMVDRANLLKSVAHRIRDYRVGELPVPDAHHVDRWISQFSANVQVPLLTELAHVLSKTYFSKAAVEQFLEAVITNEKLTSKDPCAFWSGVRFLDLQTAGNSQRDMLALFDTILRAKCGLSIAACGAKPHTYVYLDDALYSGGRIKNDLVNWINGPAPAKAKVAVITIGLHMLGQWFVLNDIDKAKRASGKAIDISWWRVLEIEDRKAYMGVSDVLRPTVIPADPATQDYVDELGAAPILRLPGSVGRNGFFSTDSQRILMEQEFLKAGARVRNMCPYLKPFMRPLGCTLMRTTGFGSTIVTYRNCANNTPLVLWAGDPWYPLFPRKTN